MALLIPFLNSTILFSSISPNYEAYLKEELWGCFKYIGIPFETLEKMPIRDRKYYIARHNQAAEEERKRSGNNDNSFTSNDPYLMNAVAENIQSNNNSL